MPYVGYKTIKTICIKTQSISQRRNVLLSYTSNMAAGCHYIISNWTVVFRFFPSGNFTKLSPDTIYGTDTPPQNREVLQG